MALLVAQTLRHGTREGLKVAIAPILADAPIVAAALLLLNRLQGRERLLGLVALGGAAYLAWLAWEMLRFHAEQRDAANGRPGSVGKALVTNLMNPHVYLFWIAVGSPLFWEAWRQAPERAAALLVGFYVCLVGAKLALAVLVGRSRGVLGGRGYTWAMRAAGVLLLAVVAGLARDGVRMLGS